MINTTGFLAVMDHGITINWDDGPTLHKLAAQVRYHTADSATARTLRVPASQRYSDDPLSFMALGDGLRASWVWQERGPGWTAQLAVQNDSEDDIYLDALDVIRIDPAFGGLFNIGAPPGLWQVSPEDDIRGLLSAPESQAGPEAEAEDEAAAEPETWSPASVTANGFTRRRQLIVQPSVSNRSHPPAVMIRALGSPLHDAPTEIQIEATGEKFDRLVARAKTDGLLIANGVNVASPEFWIVVGDDAAELKRLESD
jgi:hypothetical protein